MEVYRGDIFYVENSYVTEGSEQRPGRPALIVSNDTGNKFAPIVSVVWLTTAEKKPLPTHCEICAEVPSTAICEQIVTVSKTRLGMYIRTATEEEMQKVDKCLVIALGLDEANIDCSEDCMMIDDLKMKLEGAERRLEEEKEEVEHLKAACEDKEKSIEDKRRHIERLKERANELEEKLNKVNQIHAGVEALENSYNKLRIKCELLEEQNERLIDRLIG